MNKGKAEDVNMQPVGLANSRISTGNAPNSPRSLIGSYDREKPAVSYR